MPIQRYSAVEQFGIPIDSPEKSQNGEEVLRLFGQYSIAATEISADDCPLDITPPYWLGSKFRYFIDNVTASSASISFVPLHSDSDFVNEEGRIIPVRRVVIPEEMHAFVLTGGSPRFSTLCIHEVITT